MGDFKEQLMHIKEDMAKEVISSAIQRYPKKKFEDLYLCLYNKGIKFNIMTKEDAHTILHDLNYYYKVTVYKRNFQKNKEGKYLDLEFSYLVDISNIDMRLRYLLLEATLDIEHALKTYLITKITDNDELNGFDIVRRFFHSTNGTKKPLDQDVILEKAKSKSHYQYNLYLKHKDAPPAWVLVEIMGFGDFLRFFEFYFTKYPTEEFEIDSLMGSLYGVKSIRNASAHSNPLLFDLPKKELESVNKDLKDYAKSREIVEVFYKCQKVHDVLSVFLVHEKFVKGSGSRKYRINDFKALTTKALGKFSYLNPGNDILYFFKIMEKAIDKYDI